MSALRGDDLGLPRYNGDNYSKTWKPKGHRQGWTWESGTPARLLVLVLALAGLVFTFTSTRSGPSRNDDSQGTRAPSRHLQQQAGRRVPGSSSSSSSKRQLGFNPLLHRMYSELPPLREASSSVITGSWQLNKAIYDYAAGHPAAEVLSWEKPRVVLFRSFLSPEEVQHLIAIATPHMQRSEVLKTVGADGTAVDDSRTSSGAWAPKDDVVKRINARIHRLVAVPEQFGEGLYVLRYQERQQYLAHNDHCMPTGKGLPDASCAEFLKRAGGPECGPRRGGPTCGDRVLTFILSLKSPSQGGETVFPNAALTKKRLAAAGKQPEAITSSSGHAWYCQEPEVLGASLGTGDAIMFWDYVPGRGKGVGSYANETAQPQAQPILEALHSGCPVVEGEKWIATRWMRSTGMDYPYLMGRGHSQEHAQ